MGRRLLLVGAFVAVFVLWSLFNFAAVVFGGNHVCNLLQPVGPGITPRPTHLTNEQWAEITQQRCGGGVPYMQIVLLGTGYLVIGAIAVRSLRSP